MTTILYLIKFSMVRFPSFQFWFIWFGNFDLLDWIENFNLSLSFKSKKFLNEPLNQRKYLLKLSIYREWTEGKVLCKVKFTFPWAAKLLHNRERLYYKSGANSRNFAAHGRTPPNHLISQDLKTHPLYQVLNEFTAFKQLLDDILTGERYTLTT